MIRVKVKFFAYFREVFGAREKEMALESGSALSILLRQLTQTPEQRSEIFQGGGLKPQVVVMVNGSVISEQNFSDTKLEDGAVVAIFPMMGGG